MNSRFTADWRPLALGAVPFRDGAQAWQILNRSFDSLVGWPQLPRRSRLESMYVQFSERFPGIDATGGVLWVDPRRNLDRDLEALYLAYLEDDLEHGRIGETYAQGLALLTSGQVPLPQSIVALVGRLTGPISWGVSVVDQTRRPVLHNEILADAVGKHLRLKAAWQEAQFRPLAPRTMVMIEEPYMASVGSAYVGVDRQQVIALLEEVFAGIHGLKGVHCCGDSDWSVVLDTSVDIISLDAYDYAETLVRHCESLTSFLKRGGIIAWGIVPAGAAAAGEDVKSLILRLEQAIDHLAEHDVPRELLLQAGLISPSCGLAALAPGMAEAIIQLTAGVAAEMRRRYVSDLA